jgi:hypothetical protein
MMAGELAAMGLRCAVRGARRGRPDGRISGGVVSMYSKDRSIRWLLGVIVVLLAILVARPYLQFGSDAIAQVTPVNEGLVELGFRVPQPSLIGVPSGQYVREIQVVDSAQAFLVRYDDRIEVYRIQVMQMGRDEFQQRLKERSR